MSYTTISELPELNATDIAGSEYILITNSVNESNKLQIGNMADYIESNVEGVLNQQLVNINDKINNLSADSQITVLDEGLEVGVAKKINFIGATVNSFIDSDTGVIDVYIPSATYSSNFGLNNNNTDARLNSIQTYDRYISEPVSGKFNLGMLVPGTINKSINSNILNFNTADKFFVEKDSKIRIEIYQEDLVDYIEFLIENGNFNSNFISSYILNKQKELSHFSANFNCSIDLSSLSGYTDIKIKYIGSSTYTYNFDFFVDNSTDIIDIEIIPEIINNNYNYLSGIKYLGIGTAIKNNIVLKNSKSYSYPSNLVDIDGVNAGLSIYNLTLNDINIIDYKYNTDISFSKTYNILNNKFYNGELIIKGRVNDWSTGNYKSFPINALVNTFTDSSTRIYESFVSETNRLKHDLSVFNSINIIDINDLQIYNSRLVYPQLDFSNYYENPDYSNLTGDRSYIRKFWHSNISHSNGIFQINSNIIESDLLSGNIKIEISLDGNSWYDCSKDYVGGALIDGSGCRINSDSNSLNINNKMEFTLGLNKFTDASSNWGIYFKITIKEIAKNKYIDILQITNWN